MFERFTDRARRVVVLAQEEARMSGHNYIGTEHILLGLIHEEEGVAARTLDRLDVSLEGARDQVDEIVGRGELAPSGHIPFTPRAKRVLELALREALQLGHNYIGTEHILLGLAREGEGVGSQILVNLGADLNRVREETMQMMTARPPDTAGSESAAHDAVREASDDRLNTAARKAAVAILALPASQQPEALFRAYRIVLQNMEASEAAWQAEAVSEGDGSDS